MFETCLSAVIDEFPHLFRTRRVQVAAVACLIEFLLGLPLITQGGIYILQIIDWYCASFSLMLISFTECVAISWIYGVERFYKDIELMIGHRPHKFWSYAWRFVTPVAILFIWLFSVVTLGPVTYGEKAYPYWAVVFGWCLGVCSVIPIPLIAAIQIYRQEGSIVQRVKKLLKPTKEWGPRKEEHREAYRQSLQYGDIVKNGYVLAQTDGNNLVRRNDGHVPEEKTLLA